MNEQMDRWGSKGFVDKMLFDTQLSVRGIQQCRQLNQKILTNPLDYSHILSTDVIFVSPLYRTLQTAQYTLENVFTDDQLKKIKRIVLPVACERLYLSSDVGKPRNILQSQFPDWDYSLLSDNDEWWYRPDNIDEYIEWRPKGVYACPGEPREYFYKRMIKLRNYLESREESNIVLISHWGVIRALVGDNFENLQVKVFNKLLSEPVIDD